MWLMIFNSELSFCAFVPFVATACYFISFTLDGYDGAAWEATYLLLYF
jgi:hypothetical protein